MLATPHSDKRRKKTTATYGKAVRRQGPAHLVSAYDLSSDFQDGKIQLPVRPVPQKERESKPTASNKRQSSTDVFDFPSDSDDVVSPVRSKAKTAVSSKRYSPTARPDVIDLRERREKKVQSPEPSETKSVVSKKRQSPTPADVFDFPSDSDNGVMSPNRSKKRKLSPKVAKPTRKPAKKSTKVSPSRQTSPTIVSQASAAQPPLRKPHHHIPAEQETSTEKNRPDTTTLAKTILRGARKAIKTYSATTKSSKADVKTPEKQHTSLEERVPPPKEPIAPQPSSPDVEVDVGQNIESSRSTPDISSEFASSPRHSSPPVLTPKSAKTWKVLLGDANETSKKGKGPMKETAAKSEKPVRRRLIDTLVQQKAQTARESSSSPEPDDIDIAPPSAASPAIEMEPSAQSISASMSQPPTNGVSAAPMTPGPRITYSRQRSMLAEQDDLLGDIHMGMGGSQSMKGNSQKSRGYAPSLKSFESSIAEELEDDSQTAPAIRSVHELRQAGVSKRFMDEIDDLSDRITTITAQPSIRRSAMLELLDKVQDKTFLRNFLSSGAEHKMLATMSEETDPVCGFLLGSVILLLLDPTTATLSAARLVGLGFLTFCRRLLQTNESIVAITKQRKTNMSKIAAAAIADCHRKLLDLPIWPDARPKSLSPRTVGLACLALCLPQMPGKASTRIYVSKDMVKELFSILKSCIAPSLERENTTAQCDLLLSTSVLGHCYMPDVSGSDQPQWGPEYVHEICDVATKLLVLEDKERTSLRKVVLSLTLNITNNNGHATDIFATQDFMQTILRSICTEFNQVSDAISDIDRLSSLDALILMLGITINLVEKVDSYASILDGGDVKEALHIFSDHVAKSFEVSLNVRPLSLP